MVLFSTKFPVSDDFTQKEFLDLLCSYIRNSDVYHLEPIFEEQESNEYLFESDSQKLMVYQTKDYVAVQLIDVSDTIVSTDTYILTELNGIRVMFIRLEKTANYISSDVSFELEIPQLVRNIFWREYGGYDHQLLVDDKPYLLRKKDLELADAILSHTESFILPVVYVTPNQITGQYLLDCNELASRLLGMSHVVAVASPYVVELIQEVVNEHAPGDGDVCVVFPNGSMKLFGQDVKIEDIVRYIYSANINVTVEDALSFSKLRLSYLLSVADDDRDLSAICDELLSEKDEMINSLRVELDEANRKVSDMTAKADALRLQLSRAKDTSQSDSDNHMDLVVTEKPLYERELEDVILKILKREYDSMTGDKNLMTSRKYHVLFDILKHNQMTDIPNEIIQTFEKSVQGGTVSREGKRTLERYGFEFLKTSSGHHKVVYQNDNRYQTSMSSSPSDNRSGDNLVATYMNMLFGY